ncbi:Imm17 family immunity protein [Porphyromonas sp. oral taxon 275]|uniref:Imm17 family immunity protein n=1 Tax=Porphyromonas sp. oral taxon 275 TaxID=712435 RepID=UPI001BAAEC1C|nr:immunity 17 family protein [Porphyromonas sp. oral taxon 275]
MERLQQHIVHLGQALKAELLAHPSWAYLIIILVFVIYLVGIICDKDWAVRPAGHYSGWHMIEDFLGRTGLRIVSGFLILLAIVLLSYLFLRSY